MKEELSIENREALAAYRYQRAQETLAEVPFLRHLENPQRVNPVCQMPLTLRKKSAYAPYESWPTGSFLFWLICFSRL